MQPVELDVGGNLDPTQNLWLHMVERDFEAGDGGGHFANLRHSRSLAQCHVRHCEPQAKQSTPPDRMLESRLQPSTNESPSRQAFIKVPPLGVHRLDQRDLAREAKPARRPTTIISRSAATKQTTKGGALN